MKRTVVLKKHIHCILVYLGAIRNTLYLWCKGISLIAKGASLTKPVIPACFALRIDIRACIHPIIEVFNPIAEWYVTIVFHSIITLLAGSLHASIMSSTSLLDSHLV